MKALPLSRIAQWTGGRLHGDAGRDVLVDALVTDTRVFAAPGAQTNDAGALFVALVGERFDGHDHVAAAAARGARAALVSRATDAAIPQVVVADTQRALGAWAAALQQSRKTRVVAITGSNGKTTVKALLLSILQHAAAADGRVVYANPGNRNNEIGLPLAVIDAPDDADVAVYEMGAGKPGDIAYLAGIARPQVALVNNVAPAHLERLRSLHGVADTKAAVYDALPADGIAAINADDAFAPFFAERAHGRRLLRFALEAAADVGARQLSFGEDRTHFVLVTADGEAETDIPLPGRHNVLNALAAAALALACGIALSDIAAGLRTMQPVAGRLVRHRLRNGAVLIDDSYNANPGSLAAAIDTLAALRGTTWLVLGDMRELGADAQVLHAAAGQRAKAAGIARLFTLGTLGGAAADAFGDGGRSFDSHEALAQALLRELNADVRVLVKGSRGSAMDRIVAALRDDATTAEAGAHAA